MADRICRICGTSRSEKDFYSGDKTNRCKACEQARKRKERKERSHEITDRRGWLKKTYNITQKEYDDMFAEQKGACAICKQEGLIKKGTLCIDHNHETGEVRGLLCHSCNVALGFLKDDEKLLISALKYLKERNGKYRLTCTNDTQV